MVAEVAVQLVRAGASLAACYMFASLMPDIRAVQRAGSTGNLQLLPLLAMAANCACWGLYGVLRRDFFPLMATNAVGLGFALFYVAVYYRHSPSPRAVMLKCAATVTALALLTLYALASPEPQSVVQDHVGYASMAVCAVMFASPLAKVREVLATRNASLMPFALVAAGFVNSLLWLLYGLILDDSFVITPNLVNLFLGALQLALFAALAKPSGGFDKVDAAKKNEDPSSEITVKVTNSE
ncbi:hypothetical protein PybrP1_009288 [[Pythium] brassicae (nom. inval.)]|nr:hypothetical protein PybrP1_009288 [[Pythium] brassicae (nom. inval.)]